MKGMRYASHMLRNRELGEWKDRMRKAYSGDQIAYVDIATPIYKGVMEHLSVLARKVTVLIASGYGNPITVKEMAGKSRLSSHTASVYFGRLKKAGVIKKKGKGYVIKDGDFLRVYAIRWSYDWRKWRDAHRDAEPASVIDQFIADMQKANLEKSQD